MGFPGFMMIGVLVAMKRLLLVSAVLLLGTLRPALAVQGVADSSPVPAARASTPALLVMPLGDSITAGTGSSTWNGYRGPLQELVAGQSRYTVTFVGSQQDGDMDNPENEGHSGYQINQITDGVDGWLAAAHPQVVLLHIGINDLNHGATPERAAQRLNRLLDRIYTDQPGVPVVLQGLIPTTQGLEDQVKAFNQLAGQLPAVEAQAGHSLSYVDAPALTDDEFRDQLHPDDAGYQRMAQAFYAPLDAAASAIAAGQTAAGQTAGGPPVG